MHANGGGKPPPYAVGTFRPIRWFSVHTGGGTHRSRPTNHMGSPLVFVGRHLRVPPCRMRDGSPPHSGESVPAAGASPRPTRSEYFGPYGGFRCIPAAGHIGPALRDHTEPGSGGAEGPLALSPQQCEAWIECLTALLPTHCTKSNKNSPTLKVLLDFFQKIAGVQGAAPPVAPRTARNTRPPQRAKFPPTAFTALSLPPGCGTVRRKRRLFPGVRRGCRIRQ